MGIQKESARGRVATEHGEQEDGANDGPDTDGQEVLRQLNENDEGRDENKATHEAAAFHDVDRHEQRQSVAATVEEREDEGQDFKRRIGAGGEEVVIKAATPGVAEAKPDAIELGRNEYTA